MFATVTFSQSIQDKVAKFEQAKEYGVKYDKFKQITSVEVDMRLKSLTPTFIIDIPDAGKPSQVVYFFADRYSYFNQPTLRFLADGEVLRLDSNSISSVAVFTIPSAMWSKLVAAKTLEMQLETKETVFDDKSLKKLKNLDSLIK